MIAGSDAESDLVSRLSLGDTYTCLRIRVGVYGSGIRVGFSGGRGRMGGEAWWTVCFRERGGVYDLGGNVYWGGEDEAAMYVQDPGL